MTAETGVPNGMNVGPRGNPSTSSRATSRTSLPQSLTEAGRQLRGDVESLASHASSARSEVVDFICDYARERPIATVATAAGVGYLLGGGLGSSITRLALGIGSRLAVAVVARELGALPSTAPAGSR
ncbi:MAG TPA: hypothetical protein VGK20_08775 [Candidatus Binatia bacterium]|jgi:ElaB/YqjD/DUF883 family membrane-anchored ribosome-binding protein